MSAATQIYYASFDVAFFKLSGSVRARVEAEIDRIGSRLASYPHHRLKGSNRFRARAGDYRIIYTFDLKQNVIHLLAIGPRREIYRTTGTFRAIRSAGRLTLGRMESQMVAG